MFLFLFIESKITEVGDENMDSESEGSSSNDAEYEAHSANPFPVIIIISYRSTV